MTASEHTWIFDVRMPDGHAWSAYRADGYYYADDGDEVLDADSIGELMEKVVA